MNDYDRISGFNRDYALELGIQWLNVIILILFVALLVMAFMFIFRKWRKEFFGEKKDEKTNK